MVDYHRPSSMIIPEASTFFITKRATKTVTVYRVFKGRRHKVLHVASNKDRTEYARGDIHG